MIFMNKEGKVGISLVGLPGSGKTGLAKRTRPYLPSDWKWHDYDNDGLENSDIGL